MGWKLRDDTQELCRSIDHLLDGVQALRDAIRTGRRLDGEGERKVYSREVWCRELSWSTTDAPITADDAKATLIRMKDAKKVLTSLMNSLDKAIRSVAEASAQACQAAGLAPLPDDVLAHIFDVYIDMCDMPESYDQYAPPENSPQILSSVCRRFRQVAMHLPGLWRNVSLTFPKMMLLQHKEKCANPVVHISPASDGKFTRAMMLDVIQPPHQWRELRLHYSKEEHGHHYFNRLQRLVQSPFDSLEYLSISNDLALDPATRSCSIRPHIRQMDHLSSWKMPKLTQLKLRNFLPYQPIQCENVTSLTLQFANADEFIDETKFRDLLDSMPKIHSLSVTFDIGSILDIMVLDETLPRVPPYNHPALPKLTHLELNIHAETPADTIGQFVALVDTRNLTDLSLCFYGADLPDTEGSSFENLVGAIFPLRIPGSSDVPTFAKVAKFRMKMGCFRGSPHLFQRIFTSMPNVQDISLDLPYDSDVCLSEEWTKEGTFHRLRTLRIELRGMDPCLSSLYPLRFSALYKENCKELEKVEVLNPAIRSSVKEMEKLQSLLGDKFHWIDC